MVSYRQYYIEPLGEQKLEMEPKCIEIFMKRKCIVLTVCKIVYN